MAVDKKNAVKFHDRKAVDERTLDPPEHETNHAHPCPSATPVRFPYDSLATCPVSRSFGANLRYQATLQLPPIPDTRSDGALWPVRRRGRETSRGDRTESARVGAHGNEARDRKEFTAFARSSFEWRETRGERKADTCVRWIARPPNRRHKRKYRSQGTQRRERIVKGSPGGTRSTRRREDNEISGESRSCF